MKLIERSFLKHVATDPTPDFGSTASSTLFIKNMTDCHAAAQLIRLKDLEPCLSMYRDYVSNREVRFS